MNVSKDKVLKYFVTKNETEEPTLENNTYTATKYIHRLYNLNFLRALTVKLIVHEYVNKFANDVFDNDTYRAIYFNNYTHGDNSHISEIDVYAFQEAVI